MSGGARSPWIGERDEVKPAPQAREQEGMRVRWPDRWAGQGGAGEGYLISGSSWALPEELPTGLRAPELPLLPECIDQQVSSAPHSLGTSGSSRSG